MRIIVRTIILCGIFCFGASLANAQCVPTATDPCISINQSVLDRTSAALTELAASRDVIAKFKAQNTLTDAQAKAADVLIKNLNDLVDVRGRVIVEYEAMQKLYKSVIDMQGQIIERLEKMLNKPKSGWAKLAAILEKTVILLAGVAIGGI